MVHFDDPEMAETIRRVRERFLKENPDDEWCKAVSALTDALPVYADIGGIIAIHPDGRVILCDGWTDEIETLTDERWIMIARVQAARRFPELASLMPERPEDAPDCDRCKGSGSVSPFAQISMTCGACAGLGWVPAGRDR